MCEDPAPLQAAAGWRSSGCGGRSRRGDPALVEAGSERELFLSDVERSTAFGDRAAERELSGI